MNDDNEVEMEDVWLFLMISQSQAITHDDQSDNWLISASFLQVPWPLGCLGLPPNQD